MIYIFIFSLCCLTAGAVYLPLPEDYSHTGPVGVGSGEPFASSGEGRITGVRVWARSGAYIRGFQLRYGSDWTPVFGNTDNPQQEILLFSDEAIVQISGNYSPTSYIYQLTFVTNKGRFLSAGYHTHTDFNFYTTDKQAELVQVHGNFNSHGITSITAYWGAAYPVYN